MVVSGVANTPEQVEKYASCTLLSVAMSSKNDSTETSSQIPDNSINSCIKFLEENEFIRLQNLDSGIRYIATQLGLACLASSLPPDDGLIVFKELQKARQCFVLENELHIIYQVVPIYAGKVTILYYVFFQGSIRIFVTLNLITFIFFEFRY